MYATYIFFLIISITELFVKRFVLHLHNIIHQGPTNSSMTAVTGWTLQYNPTDDGSDVTMRSHDANTNEDDLTGLSKGTSYTVSVATNNTAGMGPFGEQVGRTLTDRE